MSAHESLATLTVVGAGPHAHAPSSPPRAATITPLGDKDLTLYIEPRAPAEPLLDLSVKRPRLPSRLGSVRHLPHAYIIYICVLSTFSNWPLITYTPHKM